MSVIANDRAVARYQPIEQTGTAAATGPSHRATEAGASRIRMERLVTVPTVSRGLGGTGRDRDRRPLQLEKQLILTDNPVLRLLNLLFRLTAGSSPRFGRSGYCRPER